MRLTAISLGVVLLFSGAMSAADAVKQPAAATPDYKLTPDALFKECVADYLAAQKKYVGKVLQVEATVGAANPWTTPTGFLLRGPEKPPKNVIIDGIHCRVAKAALKDAWQLGGAQKVRVVGKVESVHMMFVWLADCTVTPLDKCPTPRATATDVTAAYTKDAAAADKKYKPRGEENITDVIVEGTVVKLAKEINTVVHLRGTNGLVVTAQLQKADWNSLKVGDAVTIKGDGLTYVKAFNRVTVANGFLLPAGEKSSR